MPTALRAHDGHTLWVNSAALAGWEVAPRTRDGGDLREQEAWDFFDTFAAASPQETLDAVRAGLPVAHAAGVTGVHDKDGARGAPEAFAALRDAGELTLRVWQSVPNADADRGSYVKVFMDGTLGSRTALLLGGGGMRLMGPEGLAEVVREAAAAGMPVAVHAIGDLANREALDGFEATEDVWRPLGLRHRVEHAQCIHADDIARYARLGITASVQYSHATSDRELAARLWADRLDRAYPYRQLLDAGVRLAGGSDAPVEELDPLAGLAAAAGVRRTRDEALAVFTAAPAWLEGAEDRRGRLSPGCDADLVDARRRPRPRDDGRRGMGPRSAARVVGGAQPALELGVDLVRRGERHAVGDVAGAERARVAQPLGRGDAGQPQADVDPRLRAGPHERELLRPVERHVRPARAGLDVLAERRDELREAFVDRAQRLLARVLAVDQLTAAVHERRGVLVPHRTALA